MAIFNSYVKLPEGRLVIKVRDVPCFFFFVLGVHDWSWFWVWTGGYLCGIVMENCHEPPHFPFAASHSILGGVLVHFQVFKGQKCHEMFMTCVFPICSLNQVLSHDSSIKSRPSCHVASLKTYIYIYNYICIHIYIYISWTNITWTTSKFLLMPWHSCARCPIGEDHRRDFYPKGSISWWWVPLMKHDGTKM